MRTAALTACLILVTATAHAAVPDGVSYPGPAMATAAEHPDHAKLVVYFCGHCPSARSFLGEEVKALQDAVVQHQAPLEVICLTPDLEGEALTQYATALGLDHIAIGHDPANAHDISLDNILQQDFTPGTGASTSRLSVDGLTELVKDPTRHSEIGSHTFDPDGLTDPKVRQLWWAIENRQPQAIAALVAARKKAKEDDTVGRQLIALHDVVAGTLLPEIESLVSAGEDFATFEQLETALQAAEGFDTREAQKRLKELARDQTIKAELKARAAYQKCQAMLASPKAQDQEMARAGLAQLADKMPETVYGQKAAAVR